MSKELDVAVARAMGYEILDVGYFGCSGDSALTPHESPRQVELQDWMDSVDLDSIGQYYIDVASDWWRAVDDWKPSEDISVARTMEDWIEEHDLQARYAQAMMAEFLHTDDPVPDTDEQLWWALLHATPEQRCRAFLAAMGAR